MECPTGGAEIADDPSSVRPEKIESPTVEEVTDVDMFSSDDRTGARGNSNHAFPLFARTRTSRSLTSSRPRRHHCYRERCACTKSVNKKLQVPVRYSP